MTKTKILLVDDESSIRETLKIILEASNYSVVTAKDGFEALNYLSNDMVDILITDLRMPKMDGIELMAKALEIDPYIETILISAYADIKSAVKSLKMGAFDYIEKSFTTDELIHTIEKAKERKNLIEENRNLRKILEKEYYNEGVIGKSDKMQNIFFLVNRIANSKANVLLTGESGVGKEIFAKLIHNKSSQKSKDFIAINCGAIPENLIESELFGHEKGAFTGAFQRKKGKFELANNGTLFLDEIGELPLPMQVKFLRVLQEKTFFPIGSENSISVDVRIISATNKNLLEEVKNKNFREDLYYRLNVVNIEIPPLRERREDIPLLALNFLEEFSNEYNKNKKFIDIGALDILINYRWPGNVRELRNVIERSIVISNPNDEFLKKEELPSELFKYKENNFLKNGLTLKEYEKLIILNALIRNKNNKLKTADELGIQRQTLYNKIKELDINI